MDVGVARSVGSSGSGADIPWVGDGWWEGVAVGARGWAGTARAASPASVGAGVGVVVIAWATSAGVGVLAGGKGVAVGAGVGEDVTVGSVEHVPATSTDAWKSSRPPS